MFHSFHSFLSFTFASELGTHLFGRLHGVDAHIQRPHRDLFLLLFEAKDEGDERKIKGRLHRGTKEIVHDGQQLPGSNLEKEINS